MSAVAVALVGLGDIGLSAHLPALLRHKVAMPALLVDPDPARRAAAAASGVPTAHDVEAVLADDTIRAVVLATPPWVTTELTARLLDAGRYVLAEKPIAESSAAAAPLLERDTKRLQVGLTYRHDPALALLRSWLDRLGTPLLVRAHIYDEAHATPEHDARIAATLGHGSPAIHEGAHVFDWLRFLLGDPDKVADAWAVRTDPTLAAPNLTGARLDYPDGTTALVEFGWLTDRLPRTELSFLGPGGLAVLDGFTFALRLETADGVEAVDFAGERMARSFDRQLDRFVALVTGAAPDPEPSLDDALAALRIGEQIDALV